MWDEINQCVKLIDFGLCEIISDNQNNHPYKNELYSDFCGTLEYCAPEILLRKPYYLENIEVWCLGVILYILLFGRFPFITEKRLNLLKHEKKHPPIIFPTSDNPNFSHISYYVKDLIIKMLNPNSDQRITIEEINHHPWVLSHNNPLFYKDKFCLISSINSPLTTFISV